MGTIRKLCVQCAVLLGLFGFFAGPANAAMYATSTELEAAAAYATDPMFSSVGWVSSWLDTKGYMSGSGVLIAPDWVLTVGHAVTSGTTDYNSWGFSLTSSVYGTTADQIIMADAVYTYPGYTADSWGGSNNDIALIHLSQSILGVTTAALYTGTESDLIGTHAYMAGYGDPGTLADGIGSFDGIERAGENVVAYVGFSTYGVGDQYLLTEFGPKYGEPSLPMEWQATSADSGGGWFTTIDGTTYLVGLTDFQYGYYYSGAISVSYYNDWITETIASASVPEPSSLVMFVTLSLAGFPVVRRHRRKQLNS